MVLDMLMNFLKKIHFFLVCQRNIYNKRLKKGLMPLGQKSQH
jgi:hypothetical protein